MYTRVSPKKPSPGRRPADYFFAAASAERFPLLQVFPAQVGGGQLFFQFLQARIGGGDVAAGIRDKKPGSARDR